jgi:hypothetical protein
MPNKGHSDLFSFEDVARDYLQNHGPRLIVEMAWFASQSLTLREAIRIFSEENLAYRLDNDGIVHPYIDREFEANRTSALEVLRDPRLGEARADFEQEGPRVCRLAAGGRWIRTSGTAAQKPWIPAAFRALRDRQDS